MSTIVNNLTIYSYCMPVQGPVKPIDPRCWRRPRATVHKSSPAPRENSFDYCTSIYEHHYNIFYIKKLLFFSFSSCLTIGRCESFSLIVSSATGLDKSFIFIRSTRTSSSIYENSEISKRDSETENGKVCLVN